MVICLDGLLHVVLHVLSWFLRPIRSTCGWSTSLARWNSSTRLRLLVRRGIPVRLGTSMLDLRL